MKKLSINSRSTRNNLPTIKKGSLRSCANLYKFPHNNDEDLKVDTIIQENEDDLNLLSRATIKVQSMIKNFLKLSLVPGEPGSEEILNKLNQLDNPGSKMGTLIHQSAASNRSKSRSCVPRRSLKESGLTVKNKKNVRSNFRNFKSNKNFKQVNFLDVPSGAEISSNFKIERKTREKNISYSHRKISDVRDKSHNDFAGQELTRKIRKAKTQSSDPTVVISKFESVIEKGYKELDVIGSKLKEKIVNQNNKPNLNVSLMSGKESVHSVNKERNRRLTIKENVYDSLTDDEEEDQISQPFYLHPNGSFKISLDFLVLIGIIYTTCFTPIGIAFPHSVSFVNLATNICVDFVMIVDFLSSFFLAFYDFDEKLITKRNLIIIQYLKTWFLFDLIGIIPFYTLTWIKANNWLNVMTFLRLIKIHKIIYTNEFLSFLLRTYAHIFSEVNFSLINFGIFSLITAHVLSCFFIFIGRLSFPGWIHHSNLFNSAYINLYVSSLYFNLTSILSIGYGDITTVSIVERLYNIILLIVGVLIYSYTISALSTKLNVENIKTKKFKQQVQILDDICVKYRKVTGELYHKIFLFLKYDKQTSKQDKDDLLNDLPRQLKNELIYSMYEPEIKHFVFFKNYNNVEFIVQILLAFKPLSVIHNEKLVNIGDYLEETFFAKKGKLVLEIETRLVHKSRTFENTEKNPNSWVYVTSSNFVKIIEISKNEHFGDVLMLLNKRSPLRVRVKSKVAELFSLSKTDAVRISMSYPKIWRRILKKSIHNMTEINKLIHKAKQTADKVNKNELKLNKLKAKSISKREETKINNRKQYDKENKHNISSSLFDNSKQNLLHDNSRVDLSDHLYPEQNLGSSFNKVTGKIVNGCEQELTEPQLKIIKEIDIKDLSSSDRISLSSDRISSSFEIRNNEALNRNPLLNLNITSINPDEDSSKALGCHGPVCCNGRCKVLKQTQVAHSIDSTRHLSVNQSQLTIQPQIIFIPNTSDILKKTNYYSINSLGITINPSENFKTEENKICLAGTFTIHQINEDKNDNSNYSNNKHDKDKTKITVANNDNTYTSVISAKEANNKSIQSEKLTKLARHKSFFAISRRRSYNKLVRNSTLFRNKPQINRPANIENYLNIFCKKDITNSIEQNLKKNSLNLNKPEDFYTQLFENVIISQQKEKNETKEFTKEIGVLTNKLDEILLFIQSMNK